MSQPRRRRARGIEPGQSSFLDHDDSRGVRLLLEYLRVEMALRERRIAHTILVMGSTRVARASRWYAEAREFGGIVARAGRRARGVALMTGGGPGIMEAANRGAHEAGGLSIGLNIQLPREQQPNRYVSRGLSYRFRYFALRKLHFLLRARAFVAFPGGYGTLDELFETLTLVQTRKIKPLPIVLVGEHYWPRVFNAGFLLEQGMITRADARLFRYVDSGREAWRAVGDWYGAKGQALFPQKPRKRS